MVKLKLLYSSLQQLLRMRVRNESYDALKSIVCMYDGDVF